MKLPTVDSSIRIKTEKDEYKVLNCMYPVVDHITEELVNLDKVI